MPLSSESKREIIDGNRLHDSDTGSSEVQIALLSKRIEELTEDALDWDLVDAATQVPCQLD